MTVALETCAICGRVLPEDMSLMVDTERGLLVVCFICEERRDEGMDDADSE